MPSAENNLLLRLHKWARRQDENFLTEAFAHLLQHLLIHEPEAAVCLLKDITDFLTLSPKEALAVEVRTQVVTADGTHDLHLRTSKQLALLEIKSESQANPEQLKRYRKWLRERDLPSRLILLTRYPVNLADHDEQPDTLIRWYKVAEWIERERDRCPSELGKHLMSQFLGFLTQRNMTMEQVTWQLSGGVRALRALTNMLNEVANTCGLRVQPAGDSTSLGIWLEKKKYWIGIQYDEPETLIFQTWRSKVDKDAAEQLGLEVQYELIAKGAYAWAENLELESEEVHFFALSKASQMQRLERFLHECLETVKRIEIRGGEPPPDESEELDSPGTEPPSPPRTQ